MSDVNIVDATSVMGTGGLAVSSRYRVVRNSGAIDLWGAFADWWGQQIEDSGEAFFQRFKGTAQEILYPTLRGGPDVASYLEGFEQFTVPNWDGEDAAPVAKRDLDFARGMLNRVGPYLPFEPDTAAGTDGSICMEWRSDSVVGSNKIFVDVSPSDEVLTFSRLGSSPPLERHFKKNDAKLIPYLHHLFDIFSTA